MEIVSSIISSKYIIEQVQKSYNIDKIINCELLQSAINDTYKIETITQNYILKLYRHNYKKVSEIIFEFKFLSYLKSFDINVVSHLETINKNFMLEINAYEGVRYAVLMNFADGVELDYKINENAFLYGVNVAKIHKTSKTFIPNTKIKKININFMLKESIQSIENFLRKYYVNELKYFQSFFNYLLKKLQNIKLDDLEKTFCHGDLHGGNAHKNLNKIIFFDFDFSGYGLISYDISVFRWGCIIDKREEQWKDFIKGYKTIKKLDDKDLSNSLIFVAIRDLWIMHLYISRIKNDGILFIHKYYIQSRKKFLKNLEKQI
jgi:Ser/Thr protein kinase RdoA (MazF antagonist)